MKNVLWLAVLLAICPGAGFADEIPGIYKRVMDFRIPRMHLTEARVDEVIDFLRIKSKDLDPGDDPDLKGINIVLKADPEKSPRISYEREDVTIGEVLGEIATITGLEVHIASHAIVVQPPGRPVYPIAPGWEEGRVHYTFRPVR